MNGLFAAAEEIQRCCEQQRWRFCIIGGLAVQRWGEPRLTRDVDLTLLTGYGGERPVVEGLLSVFESRVPHALGFATRARVVLLRSASGVPIDVALGALPFEERAVERASGWTVPGSAALRTCGAEDLVVMKVFAGREQDWLDVRGVLVRQREILDIDLVIDELTPLLDVKGDVEALPRLRALMT